jgi:DNA-binding CsgD family transcriptional regulator
VPSFLELLTRAERQVVALTTDRLTVGSGDGNDLAMLADRTVSRQHAVFERYPAGWCVRDLGSRNGTFVNHRRVWQDQALRDGDEIQIGAARLVYRTDEPALTQPVTAAPETPPELTRREREVLVQLCRPALSGDLFTSPATSRDIADALVVTEAAVKQHLLHLYEKFGIAAGDGERRRVRLANEAIRRQAVTLADLR